MSACYVNTSFCTDDFCSLYKIRFGSVSCRSAQVEHQEKGQTLAGSHVPDGGYLEKLLMLPDDRTLNDC